MFVAKNMDNLFRYCFTSHVKYLFQMETSPLQVANCNIQAAVWRLWVTVSRQFYAVPPVQYFRSRPKDRSVYSPCIGQVRTTSGHITGINVRPLLSKYYITAYETEMITWPIIDPVPAKILVKYKTTVLSIARPPILIKNTIKAKWKR